jgi:hypothetical protein
MTFDIEALDLVPQQRSELADLADLGLQRCDDTCHLWSCLSASCWITI